MILEVAILNSAAVASLFRVPKPASSAAEIATKSREAPNRTDRSRTEDAGSAPKSVVVAPTTQSEETTKEGVEPVADVSIEPVAVVGVETEVEVGPTDVLGRVGRFNRNAHDTTTKDPADLTIEGLDLETVVVLVGCAWRQHQPNSPFL